MNREETIRRQDVLDLAKKGILISNGNYESVCKAINELPSVNPQPCGDAIDRKLVCAFIDGLISDDGERKKRLEYIRSMPPVNPQPCKDVISRQAVKEQMIKYGFLAPDMTVTEFVEDLPPVTPQPKIEKVIKMRDATPEERESVNKYIKSISKPTGVNFWDLEQEQSGDLISRQAAQDYIAKYLSQYLYNDVREAVEVIDEYIGELPPVNPQPKTGHWEQYGNSWEDKFKCSECGKEQPKILCGERIIGHWSDYCPNCGAKMESEDKE